MPSTDLAPGGAAPPSALGFQRLPLSLLPLSSFVNMGGTGVLQAHLQALKPHTAASVSANLPGPRQSGVQAVEQGPPCLGPGAQAAPTRCPMAASRLRPSPTSSQTRCGSRKTGVGGGGRGDGRCGPGPRVVPSDSARERVDRVPYWTREALQSGCGGPDGMWDHGDKRKCVQGSTRRPPKTAPREA